MVPCIAEVVHTTALKIDNARLCIFCSENLVLIHPTLICMKQAFPYSECSFFEVAIAVNYYKKLCQQQ